jgi:hypothetical protein
MVPIIVIIMFIIGALLNREEKRMRDLVIGAGEVGRALGKMFDWCDVIDIDYEGRLFTEVLHICYPYSDDFVEITAGYIEKHDPELCIIHSTVKPGTTRRISRSTAKAKVAYSPVRGRHPLDKDLRRYAKFVAGVDDISAAWAAEHLFNAGFRTQTMGNPETLELAKLFETTYSGMLIAYAQEMSEECEIYGANYYDAAQFFEEIDYLPRVVFQPGHIGGHCIMQNLELLDSDREVHRIGIPDVIRSSNKRFSAESHRRYPLSFEEAREKAVEHD